MNELLFIARYPHSDAPLDIACLAHIAVRLSYDWTLGVQTVCSATEVPALRAPIEVYLQPRFVLS